MTGAPLLTIAYSTLGARAGTIRLPPPRGGVEILVLIQAAEDDAAMMAPQRPDVCPITLQGRGVAQSRNAALDHARGQFLLFADDDVVFDAGALDRMLAEFTRDPGLVLALGQTQGPDGRLRKAYSRRPARLTRFNSAKAATYEMMLRLAPVRALGMRFDEGFGAGMPNFLGDEYIFICDLLQAGCRCRFFPVTLATHSVHSSGMRWSDPEAMRARRAVFARVFGRAGPVIYAAFRLKNWKRARLRA
ncbi:glycosyltransferase family 2 protein [Phaeovulum sp.]|uniref:glycosyltransferase family 2 protein n=1 Tax=Phaeovulum sp. TaxID=2934796 RepID=UPI0039E41E60